MPTQTLRELMGQPENKKAAKDFAKAGFVSNVKEAIKKFVIVWNGYIEFEKTLKRLSKTIKKQEGDK